jgi:hypothetical protein
MTSETPQDGSNPSEAEVIQLDKARENFLKKQVSKKGVEIVSKELVAKDGALYFSVTFKQNDTNVTFANEVFLAGDVKVQYAVEEEDKKWWVVTTSNQATGGTKVAAIHPDTLEKCKDLNAWFSINGAGVVMNVNEQDRWLFKRYLLTQSTAANVITIASYAGLLDGEGICIGHGAAIDADGKGVEIDSRSGIVTLKCRDGQVKSWGLPRRKGGQVPRLDRLLQEEMPITEARLAFSGLMDALKENLSHHGGAVALGWMIGNLYYHEVMRKFHHFPHLYLYGRSRSGKSELARILFDVVGMQHVKAMSASSNMKNIRNEWSFVSGFPMWLNELENKPTLEPLQAMVRNGFDGEGLSRTDLKGNSETFTPRRGMLMCGEELFGRDSERNRYVCLELQERGRNDSVIDKVRERAAACEDAFATLLRHREDSTKAFIDTVRWANFKLLKDAKIENRQAFCWAVAIAGLRVALCDDTMAPEDLIGNGISEETWDEICYISKRYKKLKGGQNVLPRFFDALQALHASGKIPNQGSSLWCRKINHGGREYIGLWVPYVNLQVCKELRLNDKDHKEILYSNMKEAPWYRGHVRGVHVEGTTRTFVAMDPMEGNHDNAYPFWLEDLVESKDYGDKPEETVLEMD